MNKQKIIFQILPWTLVILAIAGATVFGLTKIRKHPQVTTTASVSVNPYAAMTGETYQIIQKNYWNKISDDDLATLFLLATKKVASTSAVSLSLKNESGVEKMIADLSRTKTTSENNALIPLINNVVLNNLAPFGRSALYTQTLTKNLQNEVNNINPSDNLYAFLGVDKTASVDEINKISQQKTAQLEKEHTPEAKQELQKITRAQSALGSLTNKQRYDQTGAEPSVTAKLIAPDILYVPLTRFSPTMVQDFQQILKDNAKSAAHILVIDVRGNIGGDIDLMPQLAGAFIGPGKEAYSLYHQGMPEPMQSVQNSIPELSQYGKIILLTDGQTQSSAELLASVLKKAHAATIIGTKTRGWGTIESVFDLKNQIDPTMHYSVFLVHTLTLGDNDQPIEGSGVAPDINTAAPNWEKDVSGLLKNPSLTAALKKLFQ